jgi:hypothetical protein
VKDGGFFLHHLFNQSDRII